MNFPRFGSRAALTASPAAHARQHFPSDEEVAQQVARLRQLKGGVRAFGDVVALGRAAIPALEAVLREPSSPIFQPRCLAADALRAIGGEDALQALLRALADSLARELSPVLLEAEKAVMNGVAENLGRFADERVADALLDALERRPFPEVARALGRLGDARAIPLLVECLHDDVARDAAMEALRSLGERALPQLQRALLCPRITHGFEGPTRIAGRAAAATLLQEIGGDRLYLPLLWALGDAQPEVRLAAALALAAGGELEATRPALPVLVEALGSESWLPASFAARALALAGRPALEAVLPWLEARPTSPEESRRRLRAVDAVAALKDAEGLRALGKLAEDEDGALRLAAVDALRSVAAEQPEAVASALSFFVADSEPSLRQATARALGLLGARGVALLAGMLGDPSARVRRVVTGEIKKLAASSPAEVASLLEETTSRASTWGARRRARRLLASIGHRRRPSGVRRKLP